MNLTENGYPAETLDECEAYWDRCAYNASITFRGYVIWTEYIGSMLWFHFAVNNPYTPTPSLIRFFRRLVDKLLYDSDASSAVALVLIGSAGHKVCRLMGFRQAYQLKKEVFMVKERAE